MAIREMSFPISVTTSDKGIPHPNGYMIYGGSGTKSVPGAIDNDKAKIDSAEGTWKISSNDRMTISYEASDLRQPNTTYNATLTVEVERPILTVEHREDGSSILLKTETIEKTYNSKVNPSDYQTSIDGYDYKMSSPSGSFIITEDKTIKIYYSKKLKVTIYHRRNGDSAVLLTQEDEVSNGDSITLRTYVKDFIEYEGYKYRLSAEGNDSIDEEVVVQTTNKTFSIYYDAFCNLKTFHYDEAGEKIDDVETNENFPRGIKIYPENYYIDSEFATVVVKNGEEIVEGPFVLTEDTILNYYYKFNIENPKLSLRYWSNTTAAIDIIKNSDKNPDSFDYIYYYDTYNDDNMKGDVSLVILNPTIYFNELPPDKSPEEQENLTNQEYAETWGIKALTVKGKFKVKNPYYPSQDVESQEVVQTFLRPIDQPSYAYGVWNNSSNAGVKYVGTATYTYKDNETQEDVEKTKDVETYLLSGRSIDFETLLGIEKGTINYVTLEGHFEHPTDSNHRSDTVKEDILMLLAPSSIYYSFDYDDNGKCTFKVTNPNTVTNGISFIGALYKYNNADNADQEWVKIGEDFTKSAEEIQNEGFIFNISENTTDTWKIEGYYWEKNCELSTSSTTWTSREPLKQPEISAKMDYTTDRLTITVANKNKSDRNLDFKYNYKDQSSSLGSTAETTDFSNSFTLTFDKNSLETWKKEIKYFSINGNFYEEWGSGIDTIFTSSKRTEYIWEINDDFQDGISGPEIDPNQKSKTININNKNKLPLKYSFSLTNTETEDKITINNEDEIAGEGSATIDYSSLLNNEVLFAHITAKFIVPDRYSLNFKESEITNIYWTDALQYKPEYNFIYDREKNTLNVNIINKNKTNVTFNYKTIKTLNETTEETIEDPMEFGAGETKTISINVKNIVSFSIDGYFVLTQEHFEDSKTESAEQTWSSNPVTADFSYEKKKDENEEEKGILTINLTREKVTDIDIVLQATNYDKTITSSWGKEDGLTKTLYVDLKQDLGIEFKAVGGSNVEFTLKINKTEVAETQTEQFVLKSYQKDIPIAIPNAKSDKHIIEKVFINNNETLTVYGEKIENSNLITDEKISELFDKIEETVWKSNTQAYWYAVFYSAQYALYLVKPLESGTNKQYRRKQIILQQNKEEYKQTVLWLEPADINAVSTIEEVSEEGEEVILEPEFDSWNIDFTTNPLVVEDSNLGASSITGSQNDRLTSLFSMSPYFGIVPEDESQPKPIPTDGTIVKTIYVNTEKLSNSNILSLIKETLGNDQEYRVFQSKEGNKIKFEVCMFRTNIYREKYHLYIIEDGKIILWWDSYDGWDSKYKAESFKVNLSNNIENKGKNEKLTALFSITPYFDTYTKEVEMPIKPPKSVPEENNVNVEKIYFNTKYTGNYIIYNISRLTYTSGGTYTLYYNESNDISITISYWQRDELVNEKNPYGYMGIISFRGRPIWDWTPETSDAEWDFGKMTELGFKQEAGNYYFDVKGTNNVTVNENHKVVDIFSIEPLAENGGGGGGDEPTQQHTVTCRYVNGNSEDIKDSLIKSYDANTAIEDIKKDFPADPSIDFDGETYEYVSTSIQPNITILNQNITIIHRYKVKENGGGGDEPTSKYTVTIIQGEPYKSTTTLEFTEEDISINLGDYVKDDNKNYELDSITVDGEPKLEDDVITVNKNLVIKYTYAPTGGGGSTTCKVTAIYQNEKGTLIETTVVDENCKKGTPISELVTRFEKKIENHVLKEYSVYPVNQENDTLQEETTITYIYTTLHKVTITQSEPYEAKSTTAYVEENGIINLGDYVQNDNANYKLYLITVNGEPKSKDEPITVTEDLVITYTYILDNNADTDTEYPGNVGEDKEIQYREVFVSSVFRGVVHPSIKTELPEPEEIEGLEDLYYIGDPYKALHKPVINLEWSGENGFSNEQVTILGNQFDALITPICFNKFPDSDNNSYIGTFIAYFYNGQKAYSFKYSIVEDEEKQYHTRPFKMWIPSQVTAIGGDWHIGIEYQKTGQDSNGNERIVTAVSNTIQAHVVPNFLVAGDLNEDDVQDNIFTQLNDVNSYALMATSYDIDGNPVYTPIQTLEATGESYNLAYSGTEIDSLLGWVNTNRNQVIEHLENTTIHITAEERELWNTISSKADTTALQEEVNRATQAESTLRNNINAKANQTDLTALEDRVEETEKFIEEFDSTVINPINEHTQQIKDLQDVTTEHTSDIEELKDEDADLTRKINLINSDIDVIELNVQTNKADIGILKDDVNAFNTNIATQLNAEIAARATKDTQLEAAINQEVADRNQAINQEVADRNEAIEAAKSELDKNIDEVDNKIDEKFNETTNSLTNINQKITNLEFADIQNTNLINQVDEKVINLQNDTSIVRNNSTTEGVTTFVMKIVFLSSEEEYEALEVKEAGTLYLIREEEE